MKDANTLLQEENNRLNTIIKVLSEKVVVLENLVYAYEKNNVFIKTSSDAMLQNNIGTPMAFNATIKNNADMISPDDAMLQNNMGTSFSDDAMLIKNLGTSKLSDDTFREKVGTNNINICLLMNELKTVMKTCPEPSLNNTAKVLLHLHNNPKNSCKELRKVVELSLDGMAKHVRAMRKRNLITKVAFQQYTLSSIALKMIEKSISD